MYYDQDVGGGRWVFGNVTDDFRTYVMAFYRQLYDEGILDPDFAINTSDQWHEKLGSGKSLFFYDNMSFAVNYNRSLRQNDPDAGFTPIPIMENEKGQRRNFFYTRHWWGGGWGVSAETEYPDRIVELFDWMVDTEGFEVTNYGIEGEHYTKEGNEYFVNPDLIEKYGEMSDPFRSMRADVGTGLLQFAVLVSTKIWYLWDPPEVRGWYEMLAEDPGMREAVLEPVFTPDERDRLKVLRTEVDNLLVPAMDEVIIGNITLEEFAEVQQMARDAGADEVEEIYNRAEARLQ
jgi:ABC-type glycerol-3-phosphate transport system substrate-binding protein